MNNRYQELLELVSSCEEDYRKFHDKENREAGIRLRRTMQKIRETAAEIRDEVQEAKSGFAPKIVRPKKSEK